MIPSGLLILCYGSIHGSILPKRDFQQQLMLLFSNIITAVVVISSLTLTAFTYTLIHPLLGAVLFVTICVIGFKFLQSEINKAMVERLSQ